MGKCSWCIVKQKQSEYKVIYKVIRTAFLNVKTYDINKNKERKKKTVEHTQILTKIELAFFSFCFHLPFNFITTYYFNNGKE